MWGVVTRSLLRVWKKDKPSLLKALYQIVPSRVLETEIKLLEDWREIVFHLSRKLGIAEEALWFRVADELGVQFIERVPPCNTNVLPGNISVADLRRVGAIPLQRSGKVIAVICIDPKRAATLGLSGSKIDIYLAPWAIINRAITESETISSQLQGNDNHKSTSREDSLTLEVFKEILEEVISAEQSEVEFEFGANKIIYSYLGTSGIALTGEVSVKIGNSLLRLLRAFHNDPITSSSLSLGVSPVIQFIAGPLTRIRVSWRRNVSDTMNSFDNPLVVVVDDSSVFTKVIEKFLAAHNFRSQSFLKAREAISWISAHPGSVNAVVCDLHMPEVDGFRFLKELKGDPRLKNVPIVALTSDTASDTEIEALKLGIDAFVSKSEDPLIVLLHLQRLTQRLRAA